MLNHINWIQADCGGQFPVMYKDVPVAARAAVDIGTRPAVLQFIDPARFGLDGFKSDYRSLPPLIRRTKRISGAVSHAWEPPVEPRRPSLYEIAGMMHASICRRPCVFD